MKKQYIVIYSCDLPDKSINNRISFSIIIERMINKGYKLEGSVAITWSHQISDIVYAQALSKDEE